MLSRLNHKLADAMPNTMNTRPLSRRHFLGASTAASLVAASPYPTAAQVQPTLDLNDPADNLTAMIKMRGSLIPEDVPHWYYGTIYGVVPGKAPIAMVDFEGSEIDFYQQQPDGSYHAYGATVSFFRNTRTGRLLDVFENPITGETNEVQPNSIAVNAYYIYSIYGMKRSDDETPLQEQPQIQKYLKWWFSGDHVWLNMHRPYPAGFPIGEDQLVRGSLAELHDPALPKVHTTSSPTFMAPWLSWMDMEGYPGHTVWTGPAHKLNRVEDYPSELLALMEQNFPEKLSAKPHA